MTLIERMLAYPVGLVVQVNTNAPYSNLHGVRCIIVERSDTTDYIDVVRVIHPNENPYHLFPGEIDYVE